KSARGEHGSRAGSLVRRAGHPSRSRDSPYPRAYYNRRCASGCRGYRRTSARPDLRKGSTAPPRRTRNCRKIASRPIQGAASSANFALKDSRPESHRKPKALHHSERRSMAIMERKLSVPDIILIAGTRVAWGIGIGLLL